MRRLLLLTLLATLAVAAPASAAKLQHIGPVIDFSVVPTDTVDLTVTGFASGSPKELTFSRAPGKSSLTVGPGCSLNVLTNVARCGVGAGNSLRFTTLDRNDEIDASATDKPLDASVPQTFDTAGGNDVLLAGPLADTVSAGDGDDQVTGGPGGDRLDGQAGDDTFFGLTAGDVVDGGPDRDVLDLSTFAPGGVSVSLDGAANDGPLGSDANVVGVEEVRGTPAGDLLTGGATPETLAGAGGDDTIDTRGGGADVVNCGAGAGDVARVDGSDTVSNCETVELPPDGGGGAGGGGNAAADPPPRVGNAAAAGAGRREPAVIPARLSFEFSAFPDGTTKVNRLLARDLPSGSRAELRCTGAPCEFRRRTAKVRRGRANLATLVKGRLRAGATLEVRLTAPGMTGKAIRFTMRGGKKLPKRTTRLLAR